MKHIKNSARPLSGLEKICVSEMKPNKHLINGLHGYLSKIYSSFTALYPVACNKLELFSVLKPHRILSSFVFNCISHSPN